ncbi:MAG TPA: 2-phosphosulfolactate phosphatase [Methylomirabilota bacterium]|nr:2-phosphosulfolactate phosphatase [Methylomirabilota bacterium]
MSTRLEVLLAPAEQTALTPERLQGSVCVVFDILRATSVMITALGHGAAGLVPVMEISEAVELHRANPHYLLGGERQGFRITAGQSGGVDFHFGNSPREYASAHVLGKTIITTTTNGTRALRSCSSAGQILVGSFLNMKRLAEHLLEHPPANLILICSGTEDEASYEDTLAAGALVHLLWSAYEQGHVADSAHIARDVYWAREHDLVSGMSHARNGRRLLGIPELREDVSYCLHWNTFPLLARMDGDGVVRRFA